MKYMIGTKIAVFFTAMVIFALSVSAQPRPSPATTDNQVNSPANPAADAWITRCYSSTRKDSLECAADKAFAATRTGQIVATVSFRFSSANAQPPFMLVQLPLVVFSSSKIKVIFAGPENEELNLQYCDPQGCVFQAQMTPSLLSKVRSSAQMTVKFQNRNKEGAEIVLPLTGLGSALSKIE